MSGGAPTVHAVAESHPQMAAKKTSKKTAKKTTRKAADHETVAEQAGRSVLAIAFSAVVESKLEEIGHGAKRELGRELGATSGPSASSWVHKLLNEGRWLPDEHFGTVAAYLGLQQSELLEAIADWLRERDL